MNKKRQIKFLFCKSQSRFVSPPISRLLRHAGGHVGPMLYLKRTFVHSLKNGVGHFSMGESTNCVSFLCMDFLCRAFLCFT